MDPIGTDTTTNSNLALCSTPDPIDARDESDFTACFLRREAEIAALPRADLLPITLDVRTTVATILGALNNLGPYEGKIAELPFVNHTYCTGLEDYAGALWHAHGRFVGAAPAAEAITPLYQEGLALRETLLADLRVVIHRGVLDPRCLARIKGLSGYMNVAADLSGLAETLTDSWGKLEGKTLIQPIEIGRARSLGEQLVRMFGVRERSSPVPAEISETRQRAYTLAVRAYEELRRAVTFLRWYEQDADSIVPSLYAGRGKDHTKSGGGTTATATATAPAADVAPTVTEPERPTVPGGPGGDPLMN